MKTLAELKRDLTIGKKLTMTHHHFDNEKTNALIGIPREIIAVQSNGISIKTENGSGKSWLDFPAASLMEYDGQKIKIYLWGDRDLTAEEKSILDNRPSKRPENAKQVEMDMLSDGSTTYWWDKRYFDENNANWYWGWHKGLSYDGNANKMRDKKVKGALELEYILT